MTQPSPKSIGVHLIVREFAASVQFYRLLDLEWPEASDASEHVELDLGGGVHLAISGASMTSLYDRASHCPQGSQARHCGSPGGPGIS